MKTIIFICHGNICRSPAAEYIMKKILNTYHLENSFNIISRATSREEIGNDIYLPMKRALDDKNIPYEKHCSKQITKEEFDQADYIFYMDSNNKRYLEYLFGNVANKAQIITSYSNEYEIIDDPWYTDQFDEVVEQLESCCESILNKLR